MFAISGQVLIFSSQQQEPISIATIAPRTNRFSRWDELKRFQKDEMVNELEYANRTPVAEARGWNCLGLSVGGHGRGHFALTKPEITNCI
jgi:hypothetical protein